MAIFRLLLRVGPDRLQVGEISRRLDILPSTRSGQLSVLKPAGLLTASRNQRQIHYAANLGAVNDLIGFLLAKPLNGYVAELVR